jgi:multidrug efflux system membrane fusion protein
MRPLRIWAAVYNARASPGDLGAFPMTKYLKLSACLLALWVAACSQEPLPTASRPTPVRVQPASSGPAAPVIATSGIVATKDEMRLSFKVGGMIKAIYVEEGEPVRAGEELAQIELTEIESQLEEARQLAAKSRRDLERGERLFRDDHVISLVQLEDLRTQAALRQAQLRSVQFNRGYSVITAHSDGVVLRRLAEAHEMVPAGQPVLIIGARDRGYVVHAALADREVVQLQLGDPAEIRMDAYPDQAIAGTLAMIANAADAKSGLFPVEVRFDSLPVALASGLVAKLNLYPAASRTRQLTYVPIGAIVEGDLDRASVYVLSGDRARRRDVRVAFFTPREVALASGVEPGERVVTDGALYLQDNERIEVVSR